MTGVEAVRIATDPRRYELLRALRGRSRSVGWLVRQTGLAPNLVSHHLRELRRARLVSVQQDGRLRRYAIDERAVSAATRSFAESLGADHAPARPRPRVLFVCVHNAGRSQMAQAFFERAVADDAVADSAGSDPAEEIHPTVRAAMDEVGIQLTRRPKRITSTLLSDADVIVDMGCGEDVAGRAGSRRLTWRFTDPEGQPLSVVRSIRDGIEARAVRLASQLST